MRLSPFLSVWPLSVAVIAAPVIAAGPRPDTLAAWATYAAAVNARLSRELRDGPRFLGLDFAPDAGAARRTVESGAVRVQRLDARADSGRVLDVPAAVVQHWRGAILIPGARVDTLLTSLQRDVPDLGQEDVLRAKVLAREPDGLIVALRLRRTRFVTVVFDTEHRVRFMSLGSGRAFSESTATKIAEVEAPGTPQEREFPAGADHGFLWRWNVYWRYEQKGDDVIVECESISLSRAVPFGLGALVGPLIESTARESMERTLVSMRRHFRGA
jgi:hypothetical protein